MQKNCDNRIKGSKAQVQCEQCNLLFIAKRGSMGRFCSLACKHEWVKHDKVNGKSSYINCCKCHASLGFGIVKSSQFVGKSKNSITNGLKSAGVVRYLPEGGSWQVSAAILRRKEKAWQDDWMSEYKYKYPDWSSLIPFKTSIEKSRERSRLYSKKMHRESPRGSVYRLKKIIRSRIYNSIKRSTGERPRIKKRTVEMLGCTIDAMKQHLQNQFKDGMTWDNHGTHWHVDHIVPLSQFDFTNPIQSALATHYTNLQPMWANENLSKSDKITQTHQLRFA